MRSCFLVLCLILVTLVVVDAKESPPDTPTCVIGPNSDCALDQIPQETLIYPGGESRCMHDTSGMYGTKKEYLFRVMQGRDDDKNKLLIWFQGGGGCFSSKSCNWWFRALIKKLKGENLYEPNAKHNGHTGIFDRNHMENPFKDWTSIELPLCTADSHVGNIKRGSRHHNGAKNAEEVFKYIFKHMPNPDRIVIAGCSAGSMGAQAWAGHIIKRYREMGVTSQISVIGDSYVGNVPKERGGEVIKYWGVCDSNLSWSPELKARCEEGNLYFPDLMAETIKSNPDVVFSFLTTKADIVEKMIYCVMKHSFDAKKVNCIDTPTFHKGVENILLKYLRASQNNVAFYILEGQDHCLIQEHLFYHANIGAKRKGGGWLYLKHWVALLASDFKIKKVPSACQDPAQYGGVECNSEIESAVVDFTVTPEGDAEGEERPAGAETTEVPVPGAKYPVVVYVTRNDTDFRHRKRTRLHRTDVESAATSHSGSMLVITGLLVWRFFL